MNVTYNAKTWNTHEWLWTQENILPNQILQNIYRHNPSGQLLCHLFLNLKTITCFHKFGKLFETTKTINLKRPSRYYELQHSIFIIFIFFIRIAKSEFLSQILKYHGGKRRYYRFGKWIYYMKGWLSPRQY